MKSLLLALLILLTSPTNPIQITYNQSRSTIQLYNTQAKTLHFILHFNNSDIQIDISQKHHNFYLDKYMKYELDPFRQIFKYDYKKRTGHDQEEGKEIMGTIGLLQRKALFNLIKKAIKVNHIKLQFLPHQNAINIIEEQCRYPMFPPFSLTLSQKATHTYDIPAISTFFNPGKPFLKIINQSKSPFELTRTQLNQQITLSIKTKIISIPLKQLLECGKYSNTDTYQCEIASNANEDIGRILFYFNPVLCSNGIQFEREMTNGVSFAMMHIVLIILQFLLLFCLLNDNKIMTLINRFQTHKHH